MSIEQLFIDLGFKVLGEYNGPRTPILIRCIIHGYESKRTLEEVQGGFGCKYCTLRDERMRRQENGGVKTRRKGRNIERRRELATQMAKGHGFAIIGEYKNSRTRVLVRCSRGHESMKTANDIQQGGGCRLCYAQRLITTNSRPSSDSPSGTSNP